jgi:hypothetical protein
MMIRTKHFLVFCILAALVLLVALLISAKEKESIDNSATAGTVIFAEPLESYSVESIQQNESVIQRTIFIEKVKSALENTIQRDTPTVDTNTIELQSSVGVGGDVSATQ